MKKNLLCLIPFFNLTLTSCNVSYDSFKKQAIDICSKEHPFTKGGAIVIGEYSNGSSTIKLDENFSLSYTSSTKRWSIADTSINDLSSESLLAWALVTNIVNAKAIEYVKNVEGIKYYSTFGQLKIIDERDNSHTVYSFNKYGLVKKVKTKSSEDASLKFDATFDFNYNK